MSTSSNNTFISLYVKVPSSFNKIFSKSFNDSLPFLPSSYALNVLYKVSFLSFKILNNFTNDLRILYYSYSLILDLRKDVLINELHPKDYVMSNIYPLFYKEMWFFCISCSSYLIDTLPSSLISSFSKK